MAAVRKNQFRQYLMKLMVHWLTIPLIYYSEIYKDFKAMGKEDVASVIITKPGPEL